MVKTTSRRKKIMKKSSPSRNVGARKPSKKQSALRYKLQMLRWRWGKATQTTRLLAFTGLFGLVGAMTLLYSFAADTTPRMPSGDNQIVISYKVGMPHLEIEGEFPANAMAPSMLLYGNGLMLCSQDHGHSDSSEPLSFNQRQLDKKSMKTVYDNLKAKGFYDISDQEQTGEYIQPSGSTRSILLNTTRGASVANGYVGVDSPEFTALEQYLQEECAQATTAFDPDDIVVETINSPDNQTDNVLPAGVPNEKEPKKSKSRRVTGPEAKELKTKLTKQAKIFKADDGSVVKARYLPKVPEYEEPSKIEESLKGKVSAATTNNVRWFYVIAADQAIPGDAGSVLSEHAGTVQNYYTSRVGKQFNNVDVRVIRGSKTAAQYKVCPSGQNCEGYVSKAIFYNMWNEFKGSGLNTNILHSFDGSNGCMGWGTNAGGWNTTSTTAEGMGVTTLAGCNWYDGSHQVAAHEGGHGFTLNHTCDDTLMGTCGYKKLPGFQVPLNASQASFLKNSSPYFNQFATSKPVITLKANGTAGDITVNQGASLTINWSATVSPSTCTASGNWSGAKSATGSENRTSDTSTTGIKSYTLSCTNSAGTTTGTRKVTVASSTTTTTACYRQINFVAPTPLSTYDGGTVQTTETSTEYRYYYYKYSSPSFSSHQISSVSPSNTSYTHKDVSGHGIEMNYTPYFQAGYNPVKPLIRYNYYYYYSGVLWVKRVNKSTGSVTYQQSSGGTGVTVPLTSSTTRPYAGSVYGPNVYNNCTNG